MATSSLLAQETDAEAPSLSTASVILEESSALERLISQSAATSSPYASNNIPFALESHVPSPPRNPSYENDANNHNTTSGTDRSTILHVASITTVLSGSLSLLQIGFVWNSYLADSWFDTYIDFSVAWQKQFLPMLNAGTNVSIRSTSLAAIFSTLSSTGQVEAFMGLLLTSLIVPVLCMVLGPTWIIGSHKTRLLSTNGSSSIDTLFPYPRLGFELLIRTSFLIVFAMLLLDLGTSSIELNGPDTVVQVHNRSQSGMVSYALGMTCALILIVLFRIERCPVHSIHTSSTNQSTGLSSSSHRRVPPARAFQLPWRHSPPPPAMPLQDDVDSQRQPLLENDHHHASESNPQIDTTTTTIGHGMSMFQKIALIEVGLLSVILWLPALFLPLFRVSYEGLISEFMSRVVFKIYLWNLPAVVWHKGREAGTDLWMLLIVSWVLIALVYVLPLVATILSIVTGTSISIKRRRYYRAILVCVQPCLCGIIFAISVIAVVPGFEPLGDYLLDDATSGLCTQFHEATAETCLTLNGQNLLGVWFLLAQSISLELFVLLTICWTK